MSLQRRLTLYLLVCAPVVWLLAMLFSVNRAQHDVNELFDTELIRLARQVQVVLHSGKPEADKAVVGSDRGGSTGEADLSDMAIAVWDAQGRLILADREGGELPRRPDAAGFLQERLKGEVWRVYYLQSPAGEWLVAAGQKAYERDELVLQLTASQLLPWLLVLPVLLVVLAWSVRRALAPVLGVAAELQQRQAHDLQPVPEQQAPDEVKPLLKAINAQFARIGELLARERRFTADAAHEMRTPLAVLRAQWDVVRRAGTQPERAQAEAKFGAGLDRMDRLVTQMLALSRVETQLPSGTTSTPAIEVDWPAILAQAIGDCLPLAERRHIDFECDWPDDRREALPMIGDPDLLTVMVRNLLDNAARYAPEGTTVAIRFSRERMQIENEGPAMPSREQQRLGERFRRPEGQKESGSGLGVSIVERIAALHGLTVAFGSREQGDGMKVVVGFALEPA
jgi:two-component system sensor histidine kinase QseC